jgi:hypothetical protein
MSKRLPDVDDRFGAGDVTGRVAFDLAQQIGVVELVAEVRTEKNEKIFYLLLNNIRTC